MWHSFHLRVDHRDSGHVHFAVFAGKDPEHRAKTGDLVMTPEEFEDFFGRLKPDLVSNRPEAPVGDPARRLEEEVTGG